MPLVVARSFQQWWAKAAPPSWQQETDLNLPAGAAEQDWNPTKQWARWKPQPQLGWQQEVVLPVPGDAVTLHVAAYFERWSGKLAFHGFQPARDVPEIIPPPPTPTPGDASAMLVVPYYERFSGRLAFHGFQLARDAPDVVLQRPAEQDWNPVKPWARWKPQSFHGWQSEGEQNPASKSPPVAWQSVRQWQRWKPQPGLGWQEGSDVPAPAAPTVAPAPPLALRPYLFTGFTRQPQLGWMPAGDRIVPIVPSTEPGANVPLRPYLFQPYRPQPQLGWTIPGVGGDVVPIIIPTLPDAGGGIPVLRIVGRGVVRGQPAYVRGVGWLTVPGRGRIVGQPAEVAAYGASRMSGSAVLRSAPARSQASGVVAAPGEWIIVVDGDDDDSTIVTG